MSATALPESGTETVEHDISLPFSLYFGALNCPHWSTYDHGDEKARKEAESRRNVEKQRRMAQLPRLLDHLHHLKLAAGVLSEFDRNGQGPDAAQNLRTASSRFQAEVEMLTKAIAVDAAAWKTNEMNAMQGHDPMSVKRSPTRVHEDDDTDLDAEDLAEREAEDHDAAADARAIDQALAALAIRRQPDEEAAVPIGAVSSAPAVPTPAEVAGWGSRTRSAWPFQ